MTLRAHVSHEPSDEGRAALERAAGADVAITIGKEIEQPNAIDTLVNGRPMAEALDASPSLRRLVIPYAGLPATTRDLMLERPAIAVHNLHHNAATSAEMALALLLAAAKRIVPCDRALRTGVWEGRGTSNPSIRLAGKTALIFGYGAIGRRVGRALTALGMDVVGVRRSAGGADGSTRVVTSEALEAELPNTHVVVVCAPLTEETRGRFGAAELALLPPDSVLVNIGRADLIDEAALHAALVDGPLGAAGLDVWYRYPDREKRDEPALPSNLPFHELDQVVLSPHRGGGSTDSERLRMEHLGRLLAALARGENEVGRVDVAAGY